jgi:hypothetical protein
MTRNAGTDGMVGLLTERERPEHGTLGKVEMKMKIWIGRRVGGSAGTGPGRGVGNARRIEMGTRYIQVAVMVMLLRSANITDGAEVGLLKDTLQVTAGSLTSEVMIHLRNVVLVVHQIKNTVILGMMITGDQREIVADTVIPQNRGGNPFQVLLNNLIPYRYQTAQIYGNATLLGHQSMH